jgi:glycosyltransferase involved in cell wall biosynthesis
MRLLLVSYFFPPYNTIGAVRVGKTARYLAQLGHDVRVLTATDQPLQPSLPAHVPAENVIATGWLNVNRPFEWLLGGRRRVAAQGFTPPAGLRSPAQRLAGLYKTLLHYPDSQIGWLPYALRAGQRLIDRWRPDLIYASSPPPTSLLVAARLARQHGIPWVAELRDLWVDHSDYRHPRWRRWLEKRLEQRLLGSTAGLVTVSEPLAETLRAQYHRPTAVILNGFDPSDLAEPPPPASDGTLRVVYTGMIYQRRQSPEPLFKALAELGPESRKIRVEFYGRYLSGATALAARLGVSHAVAVHDSVAYHEALRLQQSADVLLLLVDQHPSQRGTYTGKLFEYLGARRPVLAVGPRDNVASELVLERHAGFVSDEPRAIAAQLRSWLEQKRARGTIAPIPASALAGLSRQEQTARLDVFLRSIVAPAAALRGPHTVRRQALGSRRRAPRV